MNEFAARFSNKKRAAVVNVIIASRFAGYLYSTAIKKSTINAQSRPNVLSPTDKTTGLFAN
jgi:hypothetical protein